MRGATANTTARRPATRDEHRQRALRVLVHVQSRLQGDLSLAALARVAHMSRHHFQRVFAAVAGESAAQLVRRLRLERAARELRDLDDTVRAVAERSGYTDQSTFCRSFRVVLGSWPSVWRQRARQELTRAAMPAQVRVWINRPLSDSQLRSVPFSARGAQRDARLRDATPPVRVVELLSVRVAFLSRVGRGAADHARDDFATLGAFATRRSGDGDLMFVHVWHDDPTITPAHRLRVSHGVAIGPRRRGEGAIGIQQIGGGAYAVATIAGPLAAAGQPTWRWLAASVGPLHGAVRRHGPILGMCLDDPRAVDPASRRALFDILLPIQIKKAPGTWYWRRRRPLLRAAEQHGVPS